MEDCGALPIKDLMWHTMMLLGRLSNIMEKGAIHMNFLPHEDSLAKMNLEDKNNLIRKSQTLLYRHVVAGNVQAVTF